MEYLGWIGKCAFKFHAKNDRKNFKYLMHYGLAVGFGFFFFFLQSIGINKDGKEKRRTLGIPVTNLNFSDDIRKQK